MRIDKANQRFLDYQNAKVGDVNGRELLVQITNNGVVEDQTGTTLKLNWQHENGNQGSTNFNTVDIKTGKYSLYYPKEMLYKGTVDASVEINSNGQITHTMNFKIIVHADVFNGEAGTVNGVFISLADVNKKLDDREKEYVELKSRQTSVETQFNDIQQDITDKDVISAPEIIAARNGEANLKARLDKEQQEVNEQLAQSANQFKPSWSVWEEFEQRQINVKWFGAKADGITDDKLAFQSAVDFAHSIGGATIFMPTGTYMIKSGITWKSNVSLKGAGVGKSIFIVDGKFDGVIVELSQPSHGTGTNFLENCSFEDFEIDGSGFTFTDANIRGKGLFILYMRRARFRNLYLHDTVGTALGCDFLTETVIDSVVVERAGRLFSSTNTGGQSGIGIGTNALEDETVIVTNCHTIDCGNYGIFVESQNGDRVRSRHARIVNCVAKGNRFGIGNKGAGGALIMGCSVYDNTGSGVVLNEHSNGDQIIGNKIENNGDSGILVDGSYDGQLSILDNQISNNNAFGIRLLNNLSGYSRKHVQISDNIIYENGYSGIDIAGRLYNFIVSANEVYNNGKRGSTNTNLGIGLSGENGQGNIQGNLIYDDQETKTQVVGIKFTSSTMANDDMMITNNNFPGYSTANGLFLGSGPKARLHIANNSGLIYEEFGTVTIPDGLTNVTINHSLGKVPSVVASPSNAFGQIRVDQLSTLSFTIRRPLAENTGDLVVNWFAKVNPL